jgi:hypothetical protein
MSTPEVQTESKGSVKIARNAKGEARFEVKVYVGEAPSDLTRRGRSRSSNTTRSTGDLGAPA